MNYRRMLLGTLTLIIALLVSGCTTPAKSYQQTAFSMDTVIDITAYGPNAEQAVTSAIQEMTRLDSLLSNYHDDSEISAINRNAGGPAVPISLETEQVLKQALRYATVTKGAFDPTIGPIVELWGIGKKDDFVPSDEQIAAALKNVDYRRLELDETQHTARLRDKGMSIDVGGVAKGYILDRMEAVLKSQGIQSALINGGGDIRGIGQKPDGTPWRIGLQHPRQTDGIAAKIPLTNWDDIETSGDYQRFFDRDGVRYHHIFDPKTGKPTHTLSSASTVLREDKADIPSNVLMVLGKDQSLKLLQQFPGIEAIFIDYNGTVSYTPGLADSIEIDSDR
jgi:thiamine biosynthesis lipoprotein